MIELNRHIEILLLSSDCVIVPDLGGFMTHHVCARYDEEDGMFVPPLRTLGFNPQLKMNDSLLAQSYIEAYDISYPEAVRRIEAEVNELKQQLNSEGIVELNGIGVLSLNEDGHIQFEPCEAGILTPALYGLGGFEMKPLLANMPVQGKRADKTKSRFMSKATSGKEASITIKMSWIRNAFAAIAAVILFFLITPPVDNNTMDEQPTIVKSQIELLPIPKKTDTVDKNVNIPAASAQVQDTAVATTTEADTTKATNKMVTPEPKATASKPTVEKATEQETKNAAPVQPQKETTQAVAAKKAVEPSMDNKKFCLVLASHVVQSNAEAFVEVLRKKGYNDTRINIHNETRRVVFGHYASLDEAHEALKELRATTPDFNEAWVYEIKD